MTASQKRIVIVGAGFSGMGIAIRLLQDGHTNFVIYEKNAGVGGTWETNRYPGLTCDVPAISYTYSFERSPEFSRQYPAWQEIRAYCRHVAEKFGLDLFIRFSTEISAATYENGKWKLLTSDGHEDVADVVMMATGVLRNLNVPDIAGLTSFAGPVVHTGKWDEKIDLRGKRVGVIGTGATSAQLVPAIIDTVDKLVLFQRTAHWIAPFEGGNPSISEEQRQSLRDNPERLRNVANGMLSKIEALVDGILVDKTGASTRMLKARCEANLAHIRDPELRRQLTPDYQPGCKRLIFSETFYPAMDKPNAQLVTGAIRQVEPGGIRTEDGQFHEIDVLVLATGYRMHDYMRPMRIRGENALLLDDLWKDGEFSHRGVALPGFPNLFMIMGPNSPLTNFSVIEVAEWQINYVLALVRQVLSGKYSSIAPDPEATRSFNEELTRAMPGTIWASGCVSYYLNKNGRPNVWPDKVAAYRASMQAPDLREFVCVESGAVTSLIENGVTI